MAPFRVVDEINQGMDSVNERKIFRLLVEAACQPGTPQCFLLTPKLLPDLPFKEAVRILDIMNGPEIKSVANNFNLVRPLPPNADSFSVVPRISIASIFNLVRPYHLRRIQFWLLSG